MNLGIDFGTTRTIVAYADRGNYPVVTFLDADDDAHDFFPSVVSVRDGRLVCGFDALDAAAAGGPLVRSFKRLLAASDVTGDTPVTVGETTYRLLDLLIAYVASLREALTHRSSIAEHLHPSPTIPATPPQTPAPTPGATRTRQEPDPGLGTVVIAVPAHAHSAQRFLTLEAFRRAGFEVAGMINEPSAAGFEYTHHRGKTVTSRRTRVIVYDLGGGTFDASLVAVDGTNHDVLGSLGLNQLGGDDFDAALVTCALEAAGASREAMTRRAHRQLEDECREAKEHLAPQTKRIALDVAGRDVVVKTDDFYQRATPLVEASIEAMAPLIGGLDDGEPDLTDIAGIYLVGGASGLPLVPRLLKERFGRRVHRSPYPAASTAIGLAIAADDAAGYALHDRLSRGFGVFREASEGRRLAFDALLDRQEDVPSAGELAITRRYRAAHNIGWFRFVEYGDVDATGQPRGDLMPFAEVIFPFDPQLQNGTAVTDVPVERRDHGPLVQETYTIDQHGLIQVSLHDLDTGYEQVYRLQAAQV